MRYFRHVYFTGDKHGRCNGLIDFCLEHELNENDLIIILGDSGLMYYYNTNDNVALTQLAQLRVNFLCLRGNHDRNPALYPGTELEDVGIGDKVYTYKYATNVWFAIDGGEYMFNDRTFLTIGGAYSVDKDYRISRGWNWFPDEQLSEEQRGAILKKVKSGRGYDYILSHTCPFCEQPTDLFLNCINQTTVDNTMEHWLDLVQDHADYCYWLFGHYHDDRVQDAENAVIMLYNCMVDMEVLETMCINDKWYELAMMLRNEQNVI